MTSMKNKEKVTLVMDQLSTAYGAEDMKDHQDLKDMILKEAKDLEKNQNVDLTSSRICKQIALEYLAHKENFPKSLIVLHNQLKTNAMKYDGTAIAAMMMPVWF